MYGTVTEVADDAVHLEISPGVTVRFAKAAVGRILTADTTDETTDDTTTDDTDGTEDPVEGDGPTPTRARDRERRRERTDRQRRDRRRRGQPPQHGRLRQA